MKKERRPTRGAPRPPKPHAQKLPRLQPPAAAYSPPPASKRPRVILKRNEDRRLRRGHLWVFSNEVESFPENLEPGALVHFLTGREEFLGTGFYNPHSLIAGRLLDRHDVEPDAAFFEGRLRRAWELRGRFYQDSAWRWVFGESDDLPGLVIDRYGDVCVIESYCAGMDLLLPAILDAAKRVHPWKAVVLRNDVSARRLEHLQEKVAVLEGAVDAPHWFESDGLKIAADLLQGQKTGFFFDQRANRQAVASLAQGRTVLDLFCHTGGFGLWCARAGAVQVVGVDESEAALALARTNAEANGFSNIRFEAKDVFKRLAEDKEKFGVVVLDPPKFAPSKKQLPQAVEAYVRLNAAALKRVTGGGFLATASCSQHVDRDAFRQIISRASYESGRKVQVVRWGGQAPDHPIRPSMLETEYLKFALLYVL